MSERHPLGLREITLLNLGGRRVRLHAWTGHGSEAPHDHRAPFIGIPLLGRFTETRYVRRIGWDHRLVDTWQPDGQERVYRDHGESSGLDVDAVYIRRPLKPYRCPVDAVHTYTPRGRGPHLSLVLLGRPVRDASTVWLKTEENP